MKSALTHLLQKGQNALEEMEAFNYLASITDKEAQMKTSKKEWERQDQHFVSVKSVQLYGAETWSTIKTSAIKYKPSTAASRSTGWTPSATPNYGTEHTSFLQKMESGKENGAGLDTRFTDRLLA